MYPDMFVSSKEKFPTAVHWVIMQFNTIHIAGDERSRTNPGHGYPAHTESSVSYEAYFTEEKFLEAVRELEARTHGTNYVVFKSEPLTIDKKITVSVAGSQPSA